jgi:hypothetical protein
MPCLKSRSLQIFAGGSRFFAEHLLHAGSVFLQDGPMKHEIFTDADCDECTRMNTQHRKNGAQRNLRAIFSSV